MAWEHLLCVLGSAISGTTLYTSEIGHTHIHTNGGETKTSHKQISRGRDLIPHQTHLYLGTFLMILTATCFPVNLQERERERESILAIRQDKPLPTNIIIPHYS